MLEKLPLRQGFDPIRRLEALEEVLIVGVEPVDRRDSLV